MIFKIVCHRFKILLFINWQINFKFNKDISGFKFKLKNTGFDTIPYDFISPVWDTDNLSIPDSDSGSN